MALKPKSKHRIFYGIGILIGILAIAIVLLPPMFTLNKLKPRLQHAISTQIGVDAQIKGDIHFSLLGAATIVARDINVPDGHIGAAAFRVPLHSLFDISHAKFTGRIMVYNADVTISKLVPVAPLYDLELHNCNIMFLNKEYKIINGLARNGEFKALVRTDQHKYDVTLTKDAFYITNKNNNLVLFGNLTESGGARGTLSLETDDVNRMFEFNEPKIPGLIKMETKFIWDGGYGVKFIDIRGNGFTGNVKLSPNGERQIKINATDVKYDLSFLLDPNHIMNETEFDLNLQGDLKFGNRNFNRLIVQAAGHNDIFRIQKIIANDTAIIGGKIDADGAHDIAISTKYKDERISCLFSGTPKKWSCNNLRYRGITGTLDVDGDTFTADIKSDNPMPSDNEIRNIVSDIAKHGTVKFIFSDAAGTLHIDGDKIRPEFKFARDKTLSWMRGDIEYIPEFMRNEIGDFALSGDRVTFRPHSGQWELTTEGEAFVISGKHLHHWFPKMDLRAIRDDEYFVSGLRHGKTISNLTIRAWGHEFIGNVSGNTLTLTTDTLVVDSLLNTTFIDNYEEMEFFTDSPIMLPFGLPVNISLKADKMIYNGEEYKNFVYSLKPDTQTFSISDNTRGNLLAIISKSKKNYDISIQVNKFKTTKTLLADAMPLNIKDTTITGEIMMKTWGQIAHDIEYNLSGTLDLLMTGGTLIGLGTDQFYASANNITSFNAEYAIGNALDGGESALKELHISGQFGNGNFATTEPFELSLRHATATGVLEIKDQNMRTTMDIILRGTSVEPSKIALQILPNGARRYSLSEIMTNFDSSFLRAFIKTHNKF